jgi:UDP-2,4-diacetamido-2,4,6-trideoxy-beta-L-altropyranose hydrolase
MEKIIFRADASSRMGTGHIMRCLSLAEHLQKAGGKAVFVMSETLPSLNTRLESKGVDFLEIDVIPGGFEDAGQTAQIVKDLSASWIVLDGYHFNSLYQKKIKDSGLRLLVVDDIGSVDYYFADIVLNQNLYADKSMYANKESYTSLLLGTCYVLLRPEFSKWSKWRRTFAKDNSNILVTLGGSDEKNFTGKVIEAIQEINSGKLDVVVIVPNNSHYEELESSIKKSKIHIQFKKNVENMSDLMAWADIAVSASGTSSWELAFMGLPTLCVAIADNQCQVVEALSKVGVSVNLGWYESVTSSKMAEEISELLFDVDRRTAMSKRGRNLVDGRGAERVLFEMKMKIGCT